MDMSDQYGNRVGQTDAYGNPLHGTTDAYSISPGLTSNQPQMVRPTTGTGHIGGTVLTRSGSSSSSSSEDDGMGGRRKKKGIKEKIKEKLPGGLKSTTNDHGYGGTTATGYGTQPEHHDNKGMMEKIKEKHPGGHNKTDEHEHGMTTGYGGATTGYGTTVIGAHPEKHHENKGMMEKIKEKLPGGHNEHGHTNTSYGGTTAGHGTTTGYGGTTTGHGSTVVGAHPHENKGMMEKIKEKLPGGHNEHGHTTTGYGGTTTGHGTTTDYGGTTTGHEATVVGAHPHENKGMMEKIKEKLPGGHKTDEHGYATTDYGGTTTTTTGPMTTTIGAHPEQYHEKKGVMEKIKEKLPGHH